MDPAPEISILLKSFVPRRRVPSVAVETARPPFRFPRWKILELSTIVDTPFILIARAKLEANENVRVCGPVASISIPLLSIVRVFVECGVEIVPLFVTIYWKELGRAVVTPKASPCCCQLIPYPGLITRLGLVWAEREPPGTERELNEYEEIRRVLELREVPILPCPKICSELNG